MIQGGYISPQNICIYYIRIVEKETKILLISQENPTKYSPLRTCPSHISMCVCRWMPSQKIIFDDERSED